MSSCLILYQNDKLYMSSDTSACYKDGDKYYRFSNNAKKIKIINNMIVFTAGNLELCQSVFHYLESYKEAKNFPYLLSEYLKKYKRVDNYDLEVMIGTIFENKIRIYQISSYENFELNYYDGSNQGVGVLASGIHNNELSNYVSNNFNSNIKELYRKAYLSINDEMVGGDILLYYMDIYNSQNPKLIDRYSLDDYINEKYTNKSNVHYVLAKNLVGQMILGNELGIYSEDSQMSLSFDNHGLVLNAIKGDDDTYKRIFDIQKDGESQIYCDTDGNIILKTDQVIQMTDSIDRVVAEYADIEKLYVKSATLENLLTKYAKIDDLEAFKGEFKELVATDAEIEEIKAGSVTIAGLLKSQDAEIENLKVTKVDASELTAYKATIEKLLATYATIEYLNANYIKATEIESTYAKISTLEANYATIETLNATTATINKLIAEKASVEDLNAVTAQIETLNAELVNVKTLVADKVDAEYVKAQIVESEKTITKQLDAINATIETLDTKYATIEQLNAAKANLEDLIAKKASIEDLEAAEADIGKLDALVANIDNILAGNIGTGTLQTIHLTANNVVIDDAIIKSANIEGLDVSKLNAGTINTDKFAIQSDDGGIVISGSTQQFKDSNGKVRLQIGKDAEGNFNFIVFGEDGTTAIYNQDGITKQAVPDGLIVDDMVADDANIQAKKIQYTDTEGNKTLQTVIEQEQGKISELIKETTIDNGDGTTSQLKDKYLETVKTVDGMKTTIADVETTTSSLSSKVTEIEATTDGIKTSVEEAKTDASGAKTLAEQTASKFSWIVKSGTSESDFTLTDRTAELVADNINLNGLVTFSGLSTETQEKINSIDDKADQSIVDNWAKDSIVSGETLINGGYIKSGTINIDQLAVQDIFQTGTSVMNLINAQEINANRITSGSINAERLNVYGLIVTNKNNEQQTFNISTTGEVSMRGSVSSYNYIENIAGWAIYNDGTAFFNNVTARGSVITGDGGIASSGGAGRNFARDTSNVWGDWFTPTADAYHSTEEFGYIVPVYDEDESVNNFTISFDIENTAFTLATGSESSLKVYLVDKSTYQDGTANLTDVASNVVSTSDDTILVLNTSDSESINNVLYVDTSWIEVVDLTSKCTTSDITHISKKITLDRNVSEYNLIVVCDYSDGTGKIRIKSLKVESGNYETEWSLAPEDSAQQVRFWAGATFDERETAPFIVYNDGTIKATQGNFSGVFSGTVDIGNITITDPSSDTGNDALLTIRNGENGIRRVQLTDTSDSIFAQNVSIADNTEHKMISLNQDGYGTFTGGITVGNVKLSTKSIIVNNNELTYDSYGFQTDSKFTIGTANSSSKLTVYGEAESETITVDSSLSFGSVLKFTKKYNGLNIDFIE